VAAALRDELELDPPVALAAHAIVGEPAVARDRVHQVIGRGDEHRYDFISGSGWCAASRASDRARSRLSYARISAATSGWRAASASVNRIVPMPRMPSTSWSASRSPLHCPGGRSVWVGSPVMTTFAP